MTRPHRRDKDVRNASVIAGLRLERDLATALTERARRDAEMYGLKKGNVAATARHLLRVGLGWDARESLEREEEFADIAERRRNGQ